MTDKKLARKPSNILINPGALHEALVEGLSSKETAGAWLKETIK